MLILARVCADFYDKNRNLLHRILPVHLGTFHEAPDSIKQDPLFQMLVDDGSIKFPADAAKDKALEQDPFAGTTPDGREIGAASGGYDADFEVNRNKRSVRGTVAPIEVADREKRPTVETKPEADTKPKAETKPRTTAKASVKTEAKAEEKPADSKPAETK